MSEFQSGPESQRLAELADVEKDISKLSERYRVLWQEASFGGETPEKDEAQAELEKAKLKRFELMNDNEKFDLFVRIAKGEASEGPDAEPIDYSMYIEMDMPLDLMTVVNDVYGLPTEVGETAKIDLSDDLRNNLEDYLEQFDWWQARREE